jgi:acyl-coenzyme A synthetase/AMP-(fatty) acid ligase
MFLFDQNKYYSYEELLSEINNSSKYYPYLQTKSLYDFWINFIKALAAGEEITLIDSDIINNEIQKGKFKENKRISLHFNNLAELINTCFDSHSLITIYTSGTTGQPKKINHNIKTLARSVRTGEKYSNQIWGFAYNPTHMAGIQVFLQAFANLNPLINIFNQPRTDTYIAIEKFGITHISATPTFYRLLMPFEKEYTYVQRITFGGEKSDVNLYENIKRIFPNAKINNIYASTEAGFLFVSKGESFIIPEGIKDKIKIIDNELLVHSSLLGSSEHLELDNKYYHTGDLVEWINYEKGEFKFISRKNELINIGGYKVNPNEVEEALGKMAEIKQAIVYGKQNSVLGNVLCADIVLNNPITESDIRKNLSKLLQDYKIPRRIRFIDEIELTRTGKIKRT